MSEKEIIKIQQRIIKLYEIICIGVHAPEFEEEIKDLKNKIKGEVK